MFFTHIVHLERQGLLEWAYTNRLSDGTRADVIALVPESMDDNSYENIHSIPERSHSATIETFYCYNAISAEILAKYLAKQSPNVKVYIAEITRMVQSTATEPTISNVSEKGIIPQ